jgi:hypothetical protein
VFSVLFGKSLDGVKRIHILWRGIHLDKEVDRFLDAFFSKHVTPKSSELVELIRECVCSFPRKAKSLFKLGAGQFWVTNNTLRHGKDGQIIARTRYVYPNVRNVPEWFAFHMLHIISVGDEVFMGIEEFDNWLRSMGFDDRVSGRLDELVVVSFLKGHH